MDQQASSIVHEQTLGFGARRRGLGAFVVFTFLAYVIFFLLLTQSFASAMTEVKGGPEAVHVDARNATIIEILDALKGRFKFTYKARSYSPQPVTGVYSGTLVETLEQILEGNNYILTWSDAGLNLLMLGASSQSASAGPSSGSAPLGTPNPNPALAGSPPPLANFASQNRPAETAASASP